MGANHFRILRELRDFEVISVVDPNPTYLLSTVSGSPPHTCKSLDELDPSSFDAAIVAVPTNLHGEVASQLIRMGKHLLIEKPICSNVEEARELISLAHAHSIKLAVGYVERFNPAVIKLKEVIEHGYLGKPLHYSFTRVGGYPEDSGQNNNVLIDLAVHDIDVLKILHGEMRHVASACHSSVKKHVPDTAEILLRGADEGASASIHVNWITPTKIRNLRVTGTGGVGVIDYMLQTCTVFGGNLLSSRKAPKINFKELVEAYAGSDKIEFLVDKGEPLKMELIEFAQLLRGESNSSCSGEEALYSLQLAEEVFSHG